MYYQLSMIIKKACILCGIILISSCGDALYNALPDGMDSINYIPSPVLSNIEILNDPNFTDPALDFTNDDNWFFWVDSSASANIIRDTINYDTPPACVAIDVTDNGDHWAAVQFQARYVPIESGKWYKFIFRARSSVDLIVSKVHLAPEWGGDYIADATGNLDIAVSTSWNTFELYLKSSATVSNAVISFFLGEVTEPSTLYIDSATFMEVIGNYPE